MVAVSELIEKGFKWWIFCKAFLKAEKSLSFTEPPSFQERIQTLRSSKLPPPENSIYRQKLYISKIEKISNRKNFEKDSLKIRPYQNPITGMLFI